MRDEIVISGRGLITPLGNGLSANLSALREGRSGTIFMPEWREMNLESHVAGIADSDPECPLMNIKRKRFTSPNSRMAVAASYEALLEAGLDPDELSNKRIAIILGCASSAYKDVYENTKLFSEVRKVKRVTPFIVPRVMPSSAVSNVSLILGITGEAYDISSACASSAHAIMISSRLLQSGLYDLVITGGAEEVNWVHALGFDAMRALSRKYNDHAAMASRPFDRDRDGFVIAEGAGIVVMETASHAKKRGIKPKCVVSGIYSNSNAADMVVPNSESSAEVMRMSIEDAGLTLSDIDYINTHGTSTPTGDPVEMRAIKTLFQDLAPNVAINSTKAMTGHMIGATGAVELIFTSLMMENDFLCPSINLENPDEGMEWADFVYETRENQNIQHALSNSFGFGGTNASVVISKPSA